MDISSGCTISRFRRHVTKLMLLCSPSGLATGNALVLYSGSARFKSPSEYRLSWLRFLCISSVLPNKCWDSTTIRPGRFLPIHFQFISHLTITCYIVPKNKAPLSNPQKLLWRINTFLGNDSESTFPCKLTCNNMTSVATQQISKQASIERLCSPRGPCRRVTKGQRMSFQRVAVKKLVEFWRSQSKQFEQKWQKRN
jgi:hypothetical protein